MKEKARDIPRSTIERPGAAIGHSDAIDQHGKPALFRTRFSDICIISSFGRWAGAENKPIRFVRAVYDLHDIDTHPAAHTCAASCLQDRKMNSGTVKWFNATKGYGFIAPDAGGPDVFVHISAVERSGLTSLNDGQKVTYEVVADRRSGKSSAENLKLA